MCMNCMLCYAACPVYGLEPASVGPAAIALAYRYNLDSRDEGYRLREPVLSEAVGVWECTFVGECSVVCPKGDRKSTRLNSSHSQISYAVFCLKKKKHQTLSSYDASALAHS